MKTVITQFMKTTVSNFTEEWFPTSSGHYELRNQNNPDKVKADHSMGKMAELGVFKSLRERNILISKPDFKVYGKAKKSFAPDLSLKDLGVHVKSYNRHSSFPPSWIFQFGGQGSGHTDPIIKNPKENEYVAFCVVDNQSVEIVGILSTLFLKSKNLYRDPKAPYLVGIKKAIYLEDINKLSEEERWSFVTQAAKLSS